MSGVNADYRPPEPENYWTRYEDDPDFMEIRNGLGGYIPMFSLSPTRAKEFLIEAWGRLTPEERARWALAVREGKKPNG
jgi:hypothetical protein